MIKKFVMRIFLSISLCAFYPIHSIKLEIEAGSWKKKTMHNNFGENLKKVNILQINGDLFIIYNNNDEFWNVLNTWYI